MKIKKKIKKQINMLIQNDPLNTTQSNILNQLKQELETWYKQKTNAALFKNKINWIRQGEKKH